MTDFCFHGLLLDVVCAIEFGDCYQTRTFVLLLVTERGA